MACSGDNCVRYLPPMSQSVQGTVLGVTDPGCSHDLWPAEDEEWDEERLWSRSEDDSKTNTDSEAEDALESVLAFAYTRAPAPAGSLT